MAEPRRPVSLLACPFGRGSPGPRVSLTDLVGIVDGSLECATCDTMFVVDSGVFRFEVTAGEQVAEGGREWIAEDCALFGMNRLASSIKTS